MGNELLNPAPYLLYHFSGDSLSNHPLVFRNPIQTIAIYSLDEVEHGLDRASEYARQGYWVAGFVTYEAASAFDPALTTRPPKAGLPLAWFGVFEAPETLDLAESADLVSVTNPPLLPPEWIPSTPQTTYNHHIDEILRRIAAGETYQVNYTLRLQSHFFDNPRAYYQRIQTAERPPYAAFVDIGPFQLLSFSPELFYQTTGRSISMRPMKGTMRRGRWPLEDASYESQLAASEKDRAENLMIVDLLRNDLGRIAKTGTVQVDNLFTIEQYPTVFQMTSSISATLRANIGLWETFQALFPSGSITGAPKVSTMSIISELEQVPRGIYCGAIGYIKPGGDAVFNVAIRTLTVDAERRRAEYGIGGGITWDSGARREYEEALSKAEVILNPRRPISLLETMLWDEERYALLDEHLDRLLSSARYYNIPLTLENVRRSLSDHAKTLSTTEPARVRLVVSNEGQVSVHSQRLDRAQTEGCPIVCLADGPVSKRDPRLYHKTTDRSLYDAFRSQHPECFDVILWNEDGHLTEFTIGNLVAEIDGRLVTPPLSCGLLPGTMRSHLLAIGVLQEQCLTKEDLQKATQVWLINSVRKWVKVCLVQNQL